MAPASGSSSSDSNNSTSTNKHTFQHSAGMSGQPQLRAQICQLAVLCAYLLLHLSQRCSALPERLLLLCYQRLLLLHRRHWIIPGVIRSTGKQIDRTIQERG